MAAPVTAWPWHHGAAAMPEDVGAERGALIDPVTPGVGLGAAPGLHPTDTSTKGWQERGV